MFDLVEPDPKKIEKQSKDFYLEWIKHVTGEKIRNLRELNTGRVYLKLMNLLVPGCVDEEYISQENSKENMELLQAAFRAVELKTVIPIKKLISKEEANYHFIAWFHSFFTANTLRRPSVANKMWVIRDALRYVIKSSNSLLGKCITLINPPINDVMNCIDFEHSHLSGEFWDLKRACIHYTMITQKIAAAKKKKDDKDYNKGIRDFYKLILKARDIGSNVHSEYAHLTIYPKEDKMVKLATAVTKAVDTCIKLTTETAINLQKKFSDLDVKTANEKLNKNLRDQQNCLDGAAKLVKLKLQRLRTSVHSEEKSSPMATWLKLLEAKIRAEVVLEVYKNIL